MDTIRRAIDSRGTLVWPDKPGSAKHMSAMKFLDSSDNEEVVEDPALAMARARGWQCPPGQPVTECVDDATHWIKTHPRSCLPERPMRKGLLEKVYELTGGGWPDKAPTWEDVDLHLLGLSRDMQRGLLDNPELINLSVDNWAGVYADQQFGELSDDSLWEGLDAVCSHQEDPAEVAAKEPALGEAPIVPVHPVLPVRPPSAEPNSWDNLCCMVTQLAAVEGAVDGNSGKERMEQLCDTLRAIPAEAIPSFLSWLDRALSAAKTEARAVLGPAAPSYSPDHLPAIPVDLVQTAPGSPIGYKGSPVSSQRASSPAAHAAVVDFLDSMTDGDDEWEDERQPTQWNAEVLRQGLPACFAPSRHMLAHLFESPTLPYMEVGDEVEGVDRQNVARLFRLSVEDKRDDGTERPGLPESAAAREAGP
jgi:hypothetical protein